jgi:drug/metabolite transporter (DMT)-like permease
LIGIAWMLATMFWFVTLDSTAKYLMQSYPVVQVIWARFFFHLVFVALLMGRQLPLQIRSQWPSNQYLRSLFMFATTVMFFIGIHILPLTTAATIMFLSPIIVTMLSIPLLGERVGLRRWIGIAIGFVGALVVMRPGSDSLQLSILVVLAAAFTHALYQVFTRKLRSRDGPITSLFYTAVVGAAVTSVIAPFYWEPVAAYRSPVFDSGVSYGTRLGCCAIQLQLPAVGNAVWVRIVWRFTRWLDPGRCSPDYR